MSSILSLSTPLLTLMLLLVTSSNASPISTLAKRASSGMTMGARAGMGIGIAVAALLLILVSVLFAIHIRRTQRNNQLERERAIVAGEKNPDGTDKVDKFAQEQQPSTNLRRNKSVKDRLMGPLYRGSTIELPQRAAQRNSNLSEMQWDQEDGQPIFHKPWASSSPRPSFSSRRATRMMMMM